MYSSQYEAGSIENNMIATAPSQIQKKGTITFVVFGWIFFALSLLFIPILFGAAAFFMGLMTFWERSQTHGAILMGFAIVGTLLGSLYSIIVAGSFLI